MLLQIFFFVTLWLCLMPMALVDADDGAGAAWGCRWTGCSAGGCNSEEIEVASTLCVNMFMNEHCCPKEFCRLTGCLKGGCNDNEEEVGSTLCTSNGYNNEGCCKENVPTGLPSHQEPSAMPTDSAMPSVMPSVMPSAMPSTIPSAMPSAMPTAMPTRSAMPISMRTTGSAVPLEAILTASFGGVCVFLFLLFARRYTTTWFAPFVLPGLQEKEESESNTIPSLDDDARNAEAGMATATKHAHEMMPRDIRPCDARTVKSELTSEERMDRNDARSTVLKRELNDERMDRNDASTLSCDTSMPNVVLPDTTAPVDNNHTILYYS